MADLPALNRASTAILIMDYQNQAIESQAKASPEILVKAAGVLKAARDADLPIVYITMGFREGYPELSPRNKPLAFLKDNLRYQEGTQGADIHSDVAPTKRDIIVRKRRVGAFSHTELDMVLRSMGVEHLVMFGVATSGVILSTIRAAADLDYAVTILSDCCADADPEMHKLLIERVLPRQATIIESRQFIDLINHTNGEGKGGN
jgi:nicotinamidase-related amidase